MKQQRNVLKCKLLRKEITLVNANIILMLIPYSNPYFTSSSDTDWRALVSTFVISNHLYYLVSFEDEGVVVPSSLTPVESEYGG